MPFFKIGNSTTAKLTLAFLLGFICLESSGQEFREISGVVIDQKKQPIVGANIVIEGTYDGTISNLNGSFAFQTKLDSTIHLKVSYLGYESKRISGPVEMFNSIQIKLKESAAQLELVEISASTFKAGSQSKAAALKPLDILTTAGAVGDVMGALQTLPGTQANPEDGRLFVRGGDATETGIYIDGLKVFTPYTRTIGGTPSRGRFSPLLFKGVSLSTGGYSAAYGQALSSVLDMETVNVPDQSTTNINLMSVGAGFGHQKKWGNQSLSLNAAYTNLTPYTAVVPSRIQWLRPFANLSGESMYRLKTANGLFKSYVALDLSGFQLTQSSNFSPSADSIRIRNNNFYQNTSYQTILDENTSLFIGFSLGYNQDQTNHNQAPNLITKDLGGHGRISMKSIIPDKVIFNYGLDYLGLHLTRSLDNDSSSTSIMQPILSGFLETDWFITSSLAIKTGIRIEHLIQQKSNQLLPRITIAQQLSKRDQLSLAFGQYSQLSEAQYLLMAPNLPAAKSDHYLMSYQYQTKKQMIRLEGYYKNYDRLIRYHNLETAPSEIQSDGSGYAYGIDLFWRANQMIKQVDFWVSYSWLQNRRLEKDYPSWARPTFSNNHNLSVVSKTWIPQMRSQLGLSYNFASGRPYEDPNTEGFQNELTKPFHSLNLSWAYLIDPQKILFISVSNLMGFKNEFGYRFAPQPNEAGIFPGEVIRPNDDQFFFVGFFWTLSTDKKRNQLQNL